MKKILITGGAGYIGSHTVVELIQNRYTPIIIDNLCNTSIKNITGIEKITNKKIIWHKIDCTDLNAMENIFSKEQNIEGVIHFAGFKSVEESVKDPEKYYKNNLGSLKVVLECMQKNKIQNIIFSSSCTVYGTPNKLPVDENTQFKKAESPYGETKQLCEKMLKNSACNSVSLRYFNPIGSHKSALIGDCSLDKASHLIPIMTEVAIGKRKEIIIFGNDWNTPDGTCIRDYIHVVDLAKSHVKAIDFIINNKGKHNFNVGTGIGVSVLQAIKLFEKSNDLRIKYIVGARREGDIEKIYADSSLIQSKLGWKAEESLQKCMKSAWEWEKKKNSNNKI